MNYLFDRMYRNVLFPFLAIRTFFKILPYFLGLMIFLGLIVLVASVVFGDGVIKVYDENGDISRKINLIWWK